MIQVSFEIDNGTTSFKDTVRARDISRAASVAASRYPEHDIRLSLPIDSGAFFVAESEEELAELDLTGGRQG